MSLSSVAARGAASTLVAQWLKFLINLATIMILSRLLTASDFGLVAMVTAISGIGLLLADFGLSMASIQNQQVTQHQKSNLFWINSLLGITLALVLWLASEPLASFYGREEVAGIAKAISLIFIFNAVTAQFRAEVTRKLKFRSMAIIDVLSQAVAFVLAVSAVYAGLGYWALVIQQVGMSFFILVALASVGNWVPSLPRRRAGVRNMVSFGANNLGVQLVNYTSNNVDSVLIGQNVGAESLGVYSRAHQLFMMPLQQLAAPATRVAFPILSKINGTPRYDLYIERAQVVLTYVLGGVFFSAAVLANPIIEIVLGPDWDDAKLVFYILAIGGVFQAMGYVYYWIFLSKALMGLQLRFSLISRILMILYMVIGVYWGMFGVAVGLALGLIGNWLILTVFAIPRTGVAVRPLVRSASRPLALYFVMLLVSAPAIVWTWEWSSSLATLGVLLSVIVVYLAIAFALIKPARRDLMLIVDVAKRMRKN